MKCTCGIGGWMARLLRTLHAKIRNTDKISPQWVATKIVDPFWSDVTEPHICINKRFMNMVLLSQKWMTSPITQKQ